MAMPQDHRAENQILDATSVESKDVYFCFGGAAICNMLHSRYTKIKVCSFNQKEKVSQEISILQQLSVHKTEDKDHVPDYLKYRDEGYISTCHLSIKTNLKFPK